MIRSIAADFLFNENLAAKEYGDEYCTCILCIAMRLHLAQPPDLAVLLRKLLKMQDDPFMGSEGADVLDHVIAQIEKTIRLTEDGWEWAEEGK